MIIVIGGIERRMGKTTIATNLAVDRAQRNQRVVIVDCEPEQGAMRWFRRRTNVGDVSVTGKKCKKGKIDVIGSLGDIATILHGLKQVYDHVIIDVGAENLNAMRCATSVAGGFYTPVKLEKVHSMGLDNLGEIVSDITSNINPNLQKLIFANRSAFPGFDKNREMKQTVQMVESYLWFQSTWPIMEIDAFGRSYNSGLGVSELPSVGDSREATHQVQFLAQTIFRDRNDIPCPF